MRLSTGNPTPTPNPTLTLTPTLTRCVSCWEQLGKPKRVRLVEAGPGRGTLMADVLRATTIFPAFQVTPTLTLTQPSTLALTLTLTTFPALQDALSVHLLEVSPFMRGMQRRTLSGLPLVQATGETAATVNKETLGAEAEVPLVWTNPKQPAAGGVRVEWLSQLEDMPEDGMPL
jgi:hypothetical protein